MDPNTNTPIVVSQGPCQARDSASGDGRAEAVEDIRERAVDAAVEALDLGAHGQLLRALGAAKLLALGVSYGELVGGRTFQVPLDEGATRKAHAEWTVLGQPVPRLDLPAMVTKHRVELLVVAISSASRSIGNRLPDRIRAPIVVSGADLKRTYLDLVGRDHLAPATVARVEKYRMALPLFSVYLGLDIDLADQLPNSTYWCYPHADVEQVYRDIYDGRIPDEMPIFLTSATTKDPGNPQAAPSGHSTLEVMCLAPQGTFWPSSDGYRKDPQYAVLKERLTEQLIDRATTVIPHLRQHIVWQEASSPLTHERFTLSTLGSCYGIEMAADQIGPRRPGPRTEIGGLWLTGASTIWGNGIVGAVSSGLGTAGAILRRPLSAEVKNGAVIADPSKLTPINPDWDPLAASKPNSPLRSRSRSAAK